LLGATSLAALVLSGPAAAWSWPADGDVLRPFTLGSDAYAAGQHRGIDVTGAEGSSIRAPASGTVSFAGSLPTYGRSLTILTADGYAVTLVHLGALGVGKGDTVEEGSTVATMGSSGEPEHAVASVHMGVRVAAEEEGYVDPLGLLPPRGTPRTSAPQAPSPVETTAPAPTPSPATPVTSPTPAPQAAAPATTQPTTVPPAAALPAPVATSAPQAPASAVPAPPPAASAPATAPSVAAAPAVSPTAGSEAISSGTAPATKTAAPSPATGAAESGAFTVSSAAPARRDGHVTAGGNESSAVRSTAPAVARSSGGPVRRGVASKPPSDALPAAEGRAAVRAVHTSSSATADARTAAGDGRKHTGKPAGNPGRAHRHGRGFQRAPHAAHGATPAPTREPDVAAAALAAATSHSATADAASGESRFETRTFATLALIVLLGVGLATKAARRIARDGAVLRHHADLLRQLHAAHRARVHDRRGGRVHAPSAATRP
jgi:hypothetical protein